jgi:simple sugar transport system permease protein
MDPVLFLAATLRISIPYVLASVGACFSERGGVINIALEGMMLNGALAYVLGANATGSAWAGVPCAIAAGLATAGLHALVTVRFRADQITSGLGINLLAAGVTRFVLKQVFQSSSNSSRCPASSRSRSRAPRWSASWVRCSRLHSCSSRSHSCPRASGCCSAPCSACGLRAVGERPESLATLGLSVGLQRTLGVLVSGALAGLAGAWLASEQHSFTDGMTGGRGYIALAAMIVGKWTPLGAAAACLLFGAAESLQIALQGSGFPNELLQMTPYVVTMLALAGFIGGAVPPRSVGVPYDPERS